MDQLGSQENLDKLRRGFWASLSRDLSEIAHQPMGLSRGGRIVTGSFQLATCKRCQYDLTGLAQGACCPECGEIEPSIRVKSISTPIECSDGRMLVFLSMLIMVFLLPELAREQWRFLYAISHWGPRPQFSRMYNVEPMIVLMLCHTLVVGWVAVSFLPWRMSLIQSASAAAVGVLAVILGNGLSVYEYWKRDSNIYLDAHYAERGLHWHTFVPLFAMLIVGYILRAAERKACEGHASQKESISP